MAKHRLVKNLRNRGFTMPPIIDPAKCTGCGICVDVCSEDVFFGSEKGKMPVVTYPEFCVHFNCCAYECPEEGAIKLRLPLPQMILYRKGGDA